MSYQYKRPKGKLYKVSIRKWNKTFAKRGRWPFMVVEVYLNKDTAEVHYLPSAIGKATFLLLFPLILVYGTLLEGIKETWGACKDVFFAKKRGAFSSDTVYKYKNDGWNKLMKIIGEEE